MLWVFRKLHLKNSKEFKQFFFLIFFLARMINIYTQLDVLISGLNVACRCYFYILKILVCMFSRQKMWNSDRSPDLCQIKFHGQSALRLFCLSRSCCQAASIPFFPASAFSPAGIKRVCLKVGHQSFRAFRARTESRRFLKISRELTNNNKVLVKPTLDEIQGNLLWFVKAVHEMIHHWRWCTLINSGACLPACEVMHFGMYDCMYAACFSFPTDSPVIYHYSVSCPFMEFCIAADKTCFVRGFVV